MAPVTLTPKPHRPRSRLRLVAGSPWQKDAVHTRPQRAPSERLAAGEKDVLVVGADPERRARMLQELRGLLPDGTAFGEASETWQVLARARTSRMVILTGDLGDVSAQGLMRVLGRRYPLLPVVALGCSKLGADEADTADAVSR